MLKKLQPIHLYIICIICMLISRFFESRVPVVHYVFVVIGFLAFFLAVRKYFSKK